MTTYTLSPARRDGSRLLTAQFTVNGRPRTVNETINTRRSDWREAVIGLAAHVEAEKTPLLVWRSAAVKRG